MDNISQKDCPTLQKQPLTSMHDEQPPRDFRFWLIFVSLSVCGFVVALELASMSDVLPTILHDLQGDQFMWAGSAYALAATAFMPLSGGLALAFGRRPILLGSILIFAAGSAICGAAPSLNVLIVGRTIQGLGGGGMISLTQIIVADLVSLKERGVFNGIISIAYSFGCGIAPVVGGALAKAGQWRWLFYLNIPICGVAGILVLLFLRLRTPSGTLREKLARIDYVGNILVVASTTAVVIALTWGGIQFPWDSGNILAPLIIGMIGLCLFIAFEGRFAKNAMVPFEVLSTRTGLSGYAQNFLTSLIMMALIYYAQVLFQALYDTSPLGSGVDGLGFAIISGPMGVTAGIAIQKRGSFRVTIWFGWVCMIIGCGLLCTVDAETHRGQPIGFFILAGAGIGVLYVALYFPVLAPLSVELNAQALSFFVFLRNFSLVWGITIGGTILQNELQKRLPPAFTAQFPQGTQIAYSAIPLIRTLPEPLRGQVRFAFADALKVVWQTMTGIAGLGFLLSLGMKHYKLHTEVAEEWGMEREKRLGVPDKDVEMTPVVTPS